MSGILSIATCQHGVSADIESNLSAVRKQIKLAAARGADIAHFSECNLSGYAGEDFQNVNNQDNNTLQEALKEIRELADSLNIWVIIGSHHFEENNEKPFNSLYLINDRGEILNRYDKRLLTRPPIENEINHYSPGTDPVVFSINGIACGLLICHEWRYPELYREYKSMNCKVIFQSWYDGNLSIERYRKEGKELGELITGTVRGNAANNHLWISASNTSRKESSFACFLVQPDGRILKKQVRNREGIFISRIDTGKKFIDPSSHHRNRLINMQSSGNE